MKKEITRKLIKYSAAAGAGAFTLSSANAEIIWQSSLDGFTPLSSLSNSASDDAFSIDIDNNGTDDVSFSAFLTSGNVARAFDQFSTPSATDFGFTLSPSDTSNYYLYSFAAGEFIDMSAYRGNEVAVNESTDRAGAGADFNNMQHPGTNGFLVGSAVGTRYVGLEFFRNGNTHFGWIEAEVQDIGSGALQLTVNDYAWENIAGQGIAAGAVPELSTYALSLGLLALGAAGIRARRKASQG